jgi:hypothetical protein
MAANTAPIFPNEPKAGWALLTTANTAVDGTGTVSTIFTAGADGAFVQEVRALPKGTNVASVLRVFLNNGSDPTTAANNTLFAEKTLPATTLTQDAEQTLQTITINRAIPAGHKLNVTIGTSVAAGWHVTAICGDY